MLVISNRPRASRSSDFEITRAITPWTVLHSVQLLLLTVIIIIIIIITIIIIIITSETGITKYNYKSHRKLVNVKGLEKKID